MERQGQQSRSEIAKVVLSSLRSVLSQKDGAPLGDLGDSTSLIGPGSFLDSLGLVSLIVEVEQRLEAEYGISLTLADERAMSQKNSPFRTAQSLTEYICLLMAEAQRDGRP